MSYDYTFYTKLFVNKLFYEISNLEFLGQFFALFWTL